MSRERLSVPAADRRIAVLVCLLLMAGFAANVIQIWRAVMP